MSNENYLEALKQEKKRLMFDFDRRSLNKSIYDEIKESDMTGLKDFLPKKGNFSNNHNVLSLKKLIEIINSIRYNVGEKINICNEFYVDRLKYIYNRLMPEYAPKNIKILPFNYSTRELPVYFDFDCFAIDKVIVWFNNKMGYLDYRYESSNNEDYPREMFSCVENELMEIIEFYQSLAGFRERVENAKVENSPLHVFIDYYGISIKAAKEDEEDCIVLSFKNERHSHLTDKKLKEAGIDSDDFLNNTFIKISNCPEWLKGAISKDDESVVYKVYDQEQEQIKVKNKHKRREKIRNFFRR